MWLESSSISAENLAKKSAKIPKNIKFFLGDYFFLARPVCGVYYTRMSSLGRVLITDWRDHCTLTHDHARVIQLVYPCDQQLTGWKLLNDSHVLNMKNILNKQQLHEKLHQVAADL